MSSAPFNSHYDVIVAGGGMVGSSLGIALAPLGFRIAIIEPVPRTASSQPSFDDRSTALSRSSQRMFEALGLWPKICMAATPVTSIHVSDRGRFGFSHIDAKQQGVEALGYVVINRKLGSVLRESLDDAAGIVQFCPAQVASAIPGPDQVTVELDDGRSLSCRLLVAADGAASAVRGMVGIAVRRRNYGQRAIVGNVVAEQALRGRAFERFTPQGPLAVLPVTEGRAGFVWNVSESEADRILQLDDELFLTELQNAFGLRIGEFTKLGSRASYSLVLSKAARLTAQRTVLVGNAAHGLHPAAAQGFNLGLRDVASLCECIVESNGDIGGQQLLQRYADWRRFDQQKLVGFTDGLVRIFGSRIAPVRILRDVGMLGFDFVPGVRRLFARHTMGLAGRLPRLSRGVPLR